MISGICEPLGALVFGIFFTPYMNDHAVQSLLAGGLYNYYYFNLLNKIIIIIINYYYY